MCLKIVLCQNGETACKNLIREIYVFPKWKLVFPSSLNFLWQYDETRYPSWGFTLFSSHVCLTMYSWCNAKLFNLTIGWEYSVNPSYGVYGPVTKAYHMCRRRRLVRCRELVDPKATKKQVKIFKIKKYVNQEIEATSKCITCHLVLNAFWRCVSP